VTGTVLLTAAVAGVTGCSPTGAETDEPERVTVLAAASLTDVMPQLVVPAQERHPGRTYEVSYAGSSQIVQQLNSGARADVVVLAGQGPLQALDEGLGVGDVEIVATNRLIVALAPGNPAGVRRFEDLAGDDVTLVVCSQPVPCGRATQQVFDAAGMRPRVSSYEPDVRATLSKVSSGEADAGLVYVSDVATSDLPTVPVPDAVAVLNRYPAFSLDGSEAGKDLIARLSSAGSRDIWRDAGFGVP
jgi:molybdate transport system substrate-binding protein